MESYQSTQKSLKSLKWFLTNAVLRKLVNSTIFHNNISLVFNWVYTILKMISMSIYIFSLQTKSFLILCFLRNHKKHICHGNNYFFDFATMYFSVPGDYLIFIGHTLKSESYKTSAVFSGSEAKMFTRLVPFHRIFN